MVHHHEKIVSINIEFDAMAAFKISIRMRWKSALGLKLYITRGSLGNAPATSGEQ